MSVAGVVGGVVGTIARAVIAWERKKRKYADPIVAYAILGGSAAGVLLVYKLLRGSKRPALHQYKADTAELPGDCYDVCIVGSGPSGSSCGYYLAKAGRRVLTLEKKKFPRDKHCGDAVPHMAQNVMREMGVLQGIEKDNRGHWAKMGGFVSPNGNSFVGNSAKYLPGEGPAVIAVKRIVLDERMAKAAHAAGVNLVENHCVTDAKFSDGYWTITATVDGQTEPRYFKARVLVMADGAQSGLARQLGLCHTAPDATCSRAYVKAGTHTFKADGIVFYPRQLLPGYCAVFREARDELNFCTYIIPGGKAKNEDLHAIHNDLMKNDPYVSRCLGPNVDIERMKAGSLRLGSQGVPRTYGQNWLIIGDAAGHIDPLTGEGIHLAMDGGKKAALTLIDAFAVGDFSSRSLKAYEDAWMKAWGHEFAWSMKVSLLLGKFPIVLDAAARLIQRRGADFLAEWAMVMTGQKGKTWFLRPDVGGLIALEIIREWWNGTGSK